MRGLSFSPAVISFGKDLGTRASLTVTFSDHPWGDAAPGFDKYVTERNYNPFEQGTFWGKFRARNPYLRGRNARLIRGFADQRYEDMDWRHYVMEAFDGPTPANAFTVTCKDGLKLADDDRAQAPRLSKGFLSADLAAGVTSATLLPTGSIGVLEYPASGKVAIGGSEICAFTRVGDALTLTRGQH